MIILFLLQNREVVFYKDRCLFCFLWNGIFRPYIRPFVGHIIEVTAHMQTNHWSDCTQIWFVNLVWDSTDLFNLSRAPMNSGHFRCSDLSNRFRAFAHTADRVVLQFGGLTFGHPPLDFHRFLAADLSSILRVFAAKLLIRLVNLW